MALMTHKFTARGADFTVQQFSTTGLIHIVLKGHPTPVAVYSYRHNTPNTYNLYYIDKDGGKYPMVHKNFGIADDSDIIDIEKLGVGNKIVESHPDRIMLSRWVRTKQTA